MVEGVKMKMAKQIIILLAMLSTVGCASLESSKISPAVIYQPGHVIPTDKVVIIGQINHNSSFRDVERGVLQLGDVLIRYKVGETFKVVVPRVDSTVTHLSYKDALHLSGIADCAGTGLDLERFKGEMVEVGTLVIQEDHQFLGYFSFDYRWQFSVEDGSMWWTTGGVCWNTPWLL